MHVARRQVVRAVSTPMVFVLAAGWLAGCARPLLSPEETRSPFDAYDSIRGQYAAQRIPDELGREKPNLRQRLSVKN